MGETRKLAAIFAADVVGYSCLMGEDEAETALSAIIAAHLCADRFDEDVADLFKLEDQVVARLANTLGIELVKAEAEKGARSKNTDAVDLTMRGWALARTSCATTWNTRGLTRSMIALIISPLPAPSRPSNTTQTLSPLPRPRAGA